MPPSTITANKQFLEDKYKQQHQFEKELNLLSREYNILYKDQERMQNYGNVKLNKLNKVFNIYKKEYENIVTDLSVAASPKRKRENNRMIDVVNRRVIEYSLLTNAVKSEKTYLQEIEDQIRNTRKSVEVLSKYMITDNQCAERVKAARQTCDLLENKLETQMKKFNVICTKNRQSRLEIDHLLCDRSNFITMWGRLIEKLTGGKKVMLDLIEQATIAYDQREDWCNRLHVLRLKGHNEMYTNMHNMRELKRREGNLKKLEDFYNTKGRKRVMKDLEARQKQKRKELKEKLEQKLFSYEAMVAEIVNFAREDDTNRIAIKYYNQESSNFAQFRYINDVMEEMEVMNDEVANLHLEIEESTKLHHEREKHQENTLKSLEKCLKRASKETIEAENSLSVLNSTFNIMKEGIWRLCQITRCDTDPLLQLLSDNTIIHEHNVLLFANILEKSVQDHLINAGYRDKLLADKRRSPGRSEKVISTDDKLRIQVYPIEKIVKVTPCVLCIEREMVGELVDSLQHVWSKHEAQRKLNQRLKLPEEISALHNISRCQLPKARQLMQKRYE